MIYKRIILSMLLITAILIPLNSVNAEENEEVNSNENEEVDLNSPDEIIKRENIPSTENLPEPPQNESLIGDELDVYELEVETPKSVTGEKMDGTGTVVDFTTNGARAFYTIVDNDNNTFYLIIDMDKPENNVYFLSDVSKENLSSIPTNNNGTLDSPVNTQTEPTQGENGEDEDAFKEQDQKDVKDKDASSSSNLNFLLIVVSIGLVGAFGYYFFVLKKKNKTKSNVDEVDIDDEMLESYEDDDIYSEQDYLNDKIAEEKELEESNK